MSRAHVVRPVRWRLWLSLALLTLAMVIAIFSGNGHYNWQIAGDPLVVLGYWFIYQATTEPRPVLTWRTLPALIDEFIIEVVGSEFPIGLTVSLFGMSILYDQNNLALLRWGFSETGAEIWGVLIALGGWYIAAFKPRAVWALFAQIPLLVYAVIVWLDWQAGGLPRTAFMSLLLATTGVVVLTAFSHAYYNIRTRVHHMARISNETSIAINTLIQYNAKLEQQLSTHDKYRRAYAYYRLMYIAGRGDANTN